MQPHGQHRESCCSSGVAEAVAAAAAAAVVVVVVGDDNGPYWSLSEHGALNLRLTLQLILGTLHTPIERPHRSGRSECLRLPVHCQGAFNAIALLETISKLSAHGSEPEV